MSKADLFAPYLDMLEEACFLAMKKGLSDVENFAQLVKEVETAEML